MQEDFDEAAVLAIERPHPQLWTYYLIGLFVVFPLLPLLILPAWFRYHTMRYRFTDEGISMSWGILFRKQIIIQYARIQDIHLRSNVVERWFGLARVLIQTASGNAASEMTLEGLLEYEAVRDFLYSRMRGVKDHVGATKPSDTSVSNATHHELSLVLNEVADELRALRETLRQPGKAGSDEPV